ncbi:MAG TPA: ergothioneine biosynthesis protein EgtB [Burkholderiaceae bacterium]
MNPLPRPLIEPSALAQRYAQVRAQSLALAEPLSEADAQVQSMSDVSPAKWHLAHVTWFFETFVLERYERGFKPWHPRYRVLFNSYYNQVGEQHPRAQRGLVSRPSLAEVKAYRAQIDQRMAALLATSHDPMADSLVELGLQHEQQHQELLLTDIKHVLSCNPLAPVYRASWPLATVAPLLMAWIGHEGGQIEIGHDGAGFAFDNESPRHPQQLRPYALGNRLVTHDEWAEFIADGGYADPRWWLSAGWDWVRQHKIEAPLYWQRDGHQGWASFTLHGLVPIDPHTPIAHVCYFEADAFARWASASRSAWRGARLPTAAAWEHAAQAHAASAIAAGNFVESQALHPMPVARIGAGMRQLFGDVWEWTSSSYQPYPGFRAWDGVVGEYNGKFMVNQYVLRGGSCATPRSHIRASYRNFFPTDARWQFSGVRLARDVD